MNQLHNVLKEQTNPIHLELHRTSLMQKLLNGTITAQEYKEILVAHLQVFTQFEEHFVAVDDRFKEEANSIEWLKSDLSILAHNTNDLVATSDSNISATFSSYIGYSYVKQGATMGGTVLFRKVVSHKEIDDRAVAYFRGYGVKTQQTWQQFLAYLASHQSKVQIEEACFSARHCFQSVLNKLANERLLDGVIN